jgi:hypothetical protein
MLKLHHLGFANLVLRTHAELDLTHQSTFFATKKPRFVILAAAMVSGIHANIKLHCRQQQTSPLSLLRVVAPPPGHARGGRPANGVAVHPRNFSFFFFFFKEWWGFW